MRTLLLASAAILLGAASADAADQQGYCSTDLDGSVATLTVSEEGYYVLHRPGVGDTVPGDSLRGAKVEIWGEGDEPDDPVEGLLVAGRLFLPCES